MNYRFFGGIANGQHRVVSPITKRYVFPVRDSNVDHVYCLTMTDIGPAYVLEQIKEVRL